MSDKFLEKHKTAVFAGEANADNSDVATLDAPTETNDLDDAVKVGEESKKEENADSAALDPPAEKIEGDAPTNSDSEEENPLTADEIKANYLKELGIDEAELKEIVAKKKEPKLSETEKEKLAFQEETEIDKIAIEKGLKRAEISAIKLAESKTAQEVVWENFLESKKTSIDEDYTIEDVQDDFNALYFIDSDDDFSKNKGQEYLEIEKGKILGEKLGVLKDARSEYEQLQKVSTQTKQYDAVVGKAVSELGNDLSIEVGEEKINFKVSNFDKVALEKEMRLNPMLISAFAKDQEGFSTFATDYVNARVLKENLPEIYKEIYKAGQSRALKDNAIGAERPFVGNSEGKTSSAEISSATIRNREILEKHR